MSALRVVHDRSIEAIPALTLLLSLVLASPVVGQTCPNPSVPGVTSSAVPADVCIPTGFGGNPIAFFDDFSWKSFVALVWPALTGQRGTPDPSQTVGGTGPRVFETYKSQYEVFHNDGSAPTAWNSFDPPTENPCNIQATFTDITLASFSKFSNLGQAGFGSFVGPLIVTPKRTYARFMTGFNEPEFRQILTNTWYLRASLPASITFRDGSLDVKSAWIDMTGMPNPSRYYTRKAWLMDPATGNCSQTTVGLVGLHIVQKTPTRPQWIWSTFEQVDNVPPVQTGASGSTFNDGSGSPMPGFNPYKIDPLPIPTPAPYNVTRIKPIHSSTVSTNAAYQKLLAGTPWQFYQLVMTQWPLVPSSPSTPGSAPNTFPGSVAGATTAFANTTMETFHQSSVFTSCMACHTTVQTSTDFLWSLKDHAFPPNLPNLLLADKQFKQLQSMLAAARISSAEATATAPKKKTKQK